MIFGTSELLVFKFNSASPNETMKSHFHGIVRSFKYFNHDVTMLMFSFVWCTKIMLLILIQAHDAPIRSMSWSHGHEWLLSTDDRGFVKYWQSNMNNVHTFQAHSDPVRCHRWGEDDAQQQLQPQQQHRRCSHCGVVILYSSVHLCCYIILNYIICCNDHLVKLNIFGSIVGNNNRCWY